MRLPFEPAVFLKVLAVTVTVICAVIVAIVHFQGSIAPRDVVGSLVSGVVFSYVVHLWLLPDDDEGRR